MIYKEIPHGIWNISFKEKYKTYLTVGFIKGNCTF